MTRMYMYYVIKKFATKTANCPITIFAVISLTPQAPRGGRKSVEAAAEARQRPSGCQRCAACGRERTNRRGK